VTGESRGISIRQTNARYLTALFAIVGGVAVASQLAPLLRLRGDGVTYATSALGPVLAGVLLRARGALRSVVEAAFVGALATMTLAILTFALNAGFGGVMGRSATPIVELGILLLASAVGTAAGAYLARRADPTRARTFSVMLLAMIVGTGATTLAQQIVNAAVDYRDRTLVLFFGLWITATLVGGIFTQAVVPVCRRTACALGFLLLPVVQLAYFIVKFGEFPFEVELAIWLGGTFVVGWIGAHLGWFLVGRRLRVEPDAIAAAFE
jgi:hypothetical protein